MHNDEAGELRSFISGLILNMRMNYGYAMTNAGLDPDLIFDIHFQANEGMVEWLENDANF